MAKWELNEWIALASFLAFIMHWVLAFFVVLDDIKWDAPVHLNFNIWKAPNGTSTDEGCGDVVCVTQPVYWKLKSKLTDAKIVVSLFSFVSGFNHLCTFLAFVNFDETIRKTLKWWPNVFTKSLFWGPNRNGPNIYRSIDWGISAPLMIVVNLFLYRIPADLLALFGYALFTALIVFLGYFFDTFIALGADLGIDKIKAFVGYKSFAIVCSLYLLSWFPLFLIFPYSVVEPYPSMFDGLYYNFGLPYNDANPRKPPPEVYLFIFWLFASFAVFPLVQLFKIRAFQNPSANKDLLKTYVKYEFFFIFLSALSKLPLLLLFYGGIKSRQNTAIDDATAEATPKKDYDYSYLAAGLALAVVLGLAEAYIYKYKIKSSTASKGKLDLEKPLIQSSML